jgi:transcriptional regulator of acetoin/glycerol metabolism
MGHKQALARSPRERGDDYSDLVDAFERGALQGEAEVDEPQFRVIYEVELDSWDRMMAELFLEVLTDADDLDVAATVLELPRDDLEARLARARSPATRERGPYIIELDQWDRMVSKLLAAVVADAGSVRAAAKVLDVPRSTLGQRVRRARQH